MDAIELPNQGEAASAEDMKVYDSIAAQYFKDSNNAKHESKEDYIENPD